MAEFKRTHESTEEEVIEKYNQRRCEWKEFWCAEQRLWVEESAFLKDGREYGVYAHYLYAENFYQHLLSKVSGIFPCIDCCVKNWM